MCYIQYKKQCILTGKYIRSSNPYINISREVMTADSNKRSLGIVLIWRFQFSIDIFKFFYQNLMLIRKRTVWGSRWKRGWLPCAPDWSDVFKKRGPSVQAGVKTLTSGILERIDLAWRSTPFLVSRGNRCVPLMHIGQVMKTFVGRIQGGMVLGVPPSNYG